MFLNGGRFLCSKSIFFKFFSTETLDEPIYIIIVCGTYPTSREFLFAIARNGIRAVKLPLNIIDHMIIRMNRAYIAVCGTTLWHTTPV
jgi:hypothetical protein